MASLADHLKKQSEQGASTYYNIDIIKYEVWMKLTCYYYSQEGILGTFWVFLRVLIYFLHRVLVSWSAQLTLIWVLNGQFSREFKGYASPESLKLRGSEMLFYRFFHGLPKNRSSWRSRCTTPWPHASSLATALTVPRQGLLCLVYKSRKPMLSLNYSLQVTHVRKSRWLRNWSTV